MKKIFNVFLFILLTVLCIHTSTKVSANSAQTYFYGEDRRGVLQVADSPIEVIHEDLKFYINSLPLTYYEGDTYDGSFSAKYTFKNPTNEAVDVTLAFPFGYMPSYYYSTIDTSKYSLYVNDEKLNYEVRSCLGDRYSDESVDYLSKISNSYLEEHPEITITKYTVSVSSSSDDFSIVYNHGEIPVASSNYYLNNADGLSYSVYGVHSKTIELYFFDEVDTELENNISCYITGSYKNNYKKTFIESTVTIDEVTTLTFEEYMLRGYDAELFNIYDYYNMNLELYKESKENQYFYAFNSSPLSDSDYYNVLRWYVYDLHFEANGTITNEVTGPIYPNVDESYNSTVGYFTYLLTPAKTWASFSDLDVYIYTNFYITDSNRQFVRNDEDGCYQFHLDSLDDEELKFALCEIENPERRRTALGVFLIVLGVVAILGLIVAAVPGVFAIVILIITLCKKNKKNKHYTYLLLQAIMMVVTGTNIIGFIGYFRAYGEPLYAGIVGLALVFILEGITVFDAIKYQTKISTLRIIGCSIGVAISILSFVFHFIANEYFDPTSSLGILVMTSLFLFVTYVIGYFKTLKNYNSIEKEIEKNQIEEEKQSE